MRLKTDDINLKLKKGFFPNMHTMSYRRLMDVEMTSCVYCVTTKMRQKTKTKKKQPSATGKLKNNIEKLSLN